LPRILRHKTYHFRNLKDKEYFFDAPEVILVGKNGQGKTNILESIYMLCLANSFRSRKFEDICRMGMHDMSVKGYFYSDIDISVFFENKKKTVYVNDKILKDRRDLLHNVQCVAFVHEDIQYINGSPLLRRRYLDQCLSIINPLYIDVLRSYKKVLYNRNIILKSQDTILLDVLDMQLVEYGMQIVQERLGFLERFSSRIGEIFSHVSGMKSLLKITYKTSWKNSEKEKILSYVKTVRDKELLMRMTLTGPHRDDIDVFFSGKNFTSVASTGQIRLLSLIFKIIQAQISNETYSYQPILLFDDVLLELDEIYQNRFLSFIPPYDQVFFTFLKEKQFQRFYTKQTKYYTVHAGDIYEGSR